MAALLLCSWLEGKQVNRHDRIYTDTTPTAGEDWSDVERGSSTCSKYTSHRNGVGLIRLGECARKRPMLVARAVPTAFPF